MACFDSGYIYILSEKTETMKRKFGQRDTGTYGMYGV